MKTGIFFHQSFFLHDTGLSHPENYTRVDKIINILNKLESDSLAKFSCPYVTEKQLHLVHDKFYVDKIINYFPLKESIFLDSDTILSPGSLEAILRSPGGVISAIEMVNSKKIKNAFCVVRPPGHHATFSNGMGFCIFNNIAIGSAYAIKQLGIEKVAIIDLDVHHGNGTEEWVANQENCLFVSIHQSPLYPGTGVELEHPRKNIINHVLSPGASSNDFRLLIENKLIPSIELFNPDIILLSIGFDGHKLDSISDLQLISEDYGWATEKICDIAEKCCCGKVVSVLEGGYNFDALEESSSYHVAALSKAANI